MHNVSPLTDHLHRHQVFRHGNVQESVLISTTCTFIWIELGGDASATTDDYPIEPSKTLVIQMQLLAMSVGPYKEIDAIVVAKVFVVLSHELVRRKVRHENLPASS